MNKTEENKEDAATKKLSTGMSKGRCEELTRKSVANTQKPVTKWNDTAAMTGSNLVTPPPQVGNSSAGSSSGKGRRRKKTRRSSMPGSFSGTILATSPPPRMRSHSLEQKQNRRGSQASSKTAASHPKQQSAGEELTMDVSEKEQCHDFSPQGSFAGGESIASNFSVQMERLQQTLSKRRGSIGNSSIASTNSSRSSNELIAQMELLKAHMNGSSDGSVGSDSRGKRGMIANGVRLTRAASSNSLRSTDSSIMDAFFDPTADSPRYLTIYYATQSGTSEFYAYSLQQEGRAMDLDVGICNVSHLVQSIETSIDHELSDILVPHTTKSGKKRGRAVFLISTYNGEFSSRRFLTTSSVDYFNNSN